MRVVSTNELSNVVGNDDSPYTPAYSCSVNPAATTSRPFTARVDPGRDLNDVNGSTWLISRQI